MLPDWVFPDVWLMQVLGFDPAGRRLLPQFLVSSQSDVAEFQRSIHIQGLTEIKEENVLESQSISWKIVFVSNI